MAFVENTIGVALTVFDYCSSSITKTRSDIKMVDVLHTNSWELNTEQLIEKRNKIRKTMWFMMALWVFLFCFGLVAYIYEAVLGGVILLECVFTFMMTMMLKNYEFSISIIICQRVKKE